MALVTLATMRTRIRQRTDNEHTDSDYISDAELNQLINTSYARLYGNLMRFGIQTSESLYTFNTAASTVLYSLPSDFYSLLSLFRVEGTRRVRLVRHSHRYRPDTGNMGQPLTYRITGSQLQLDPVPSGVYAMELIYQPTPTELALDADTLDGVLGWEEFVVVDVACKLFAKDNDGEVPQALLMERKDLIQQIQDEAIAVEMTETNMVEDVRAQSLDLEGEYTNYRGYRGSLDLGRIRWR